MAKDLEQPREVHGFWGLVVGMTLGAAGASLMKHGSLGMTSFYSVSLCLWEATGHFTMGTWNTLFQLFLIAILILLQRRMSMRYLLSFAAAWVQSMMMDGFNLLFAALPGGLAARVVSFAAGFGIMSAGIAVLAVCGLPVAPMNLFVREIAEKLHTGFHQVKSVFDLSCLGLSAAIGLLCLHRLSGIGWGTLIAAFLTGPLTGFYLRWLNRKVRFYTGPRRKKPS